MSGKIGDAAVMNGGNEIIGMRVEGEEWNNI